MAEINAQLVKQLRERTGAGMMECKKALVEANGDLAAAEVILRKRGITNAGHKEARTTKQGLVSSFISPDASSGVLLEINCESDFVARTEDFQTLASNIAEHIAAKKPKVVRLAAVAESERAEFKAHEALYEQKFAGGDEDHTVADFVRSNIAKLGENINISRFVLYEVQGSGSIGRYIHTGSQIGVLLEARTSQPETAGKEEFRKLIHDVAMQVAAASPQFVGKDDVAADVLERERDIQKGRARTEGKPEKMLDKIVEGRMSKFYEEICLLEQPFIRENSISVAELIKTAGAKLGDSITITRFTRYKVGDAGDVAGVDESPLPVTA